MEIIVHRGTHQIGGCAAEVRTKNARILIDFGAELPDAAGRHPPDDLKIDGLNCGTPDFDGVLLTHYHGDHLGLIAQVPDSIPIYLGRNAIAVHQIYVKRLGNNAPEEMRKAAGRLRPLDALSSFVIGDMTVTPLPADHSAWDALMFLIEAGEKRILHTGDFRLHGFRGKHTLQLLSRYTAGADLLMIEGTQLSGSRHEAVSEQALQEKIRDEIKENKYVFALCASTNIDRLALLHNATPRGRYFLCDRYQKDILETVRAGARSSYYQFSKALVYGKNLEPKLRERGFVMAVRPGSYFSQTAAQYPETILIYSMWEGYLDGRNPALSEFVRPFAETRRIRYLHASGHATAQALKQVCDTVQPRLGVLPIHSEQPERFHELGLRYPILSLADGEIFSL